MSAPSDPASRLPVWSCSPRWHYAKGIMRFMIFTLAACIFGLFSYNWDLAEMLVPVMGLDCVCQLGGLIILYLSGKTKKRCIHPVAHLIYDLLLWMAYYSIAVTYDIVMSANEAHSVIQESYSVKITISVLTHCIWLLHFALFIRSCVEVHRYRKSKSAPDVVYFPSGQEEPSQSELDAEAGQRADASSSMSSLYKPYAELDEPKTLRVHDV